MTERFLITLSTAEGAEKFTTRRGSLSAAQIEAERLAASEPGHIAEVFDTRPVGSFRQVYKTVNGGDDGHRDVDRRRGDSGRDVDPVEAGPVATPEQAGGGPADR